MGTRLDTLVHVRGMRGTGRSVFPVVAVSAILVALLSTAWLMRGIVFAPDPPVKADKIRAVVQLPPDVFGQCQSFEFDNETGLMKPTGDVSCSYSQTRQIRQLDGIRNYLQSH